MEGRGWWSRERVHLEYAPWGGTALQAKGGGADNRARTACGPRTNMSTRPLALKHLRFPGQV